MNDNCRVNIPKVCKDLKHTTFGLPIGISIHNPYKQILRCFFCEKKISQRNQIGNFSMKATRSTTLVSKCYIAKNFVYLDFASRGIGATQTYVVGSLLFLLLTQCLY